MAVARLSGVRLRHVVAVFACGLSLSACAVTHDGRGLFAGLPADFLAGRYHSLAATRVPDCFEISATASDGEVMAVRHRELPIVGVQFHPESVLTPDGPALARNFLEGRL